MASVPAAGSGSRHPGSTLRTAPTRGARRGSEGGPVQLSLGLPGPVTGHLGEAHSGGRGEFARRSNDCLACTLQKLSLHACNDVNVDLVGGARPCLQRVHRLGRPHGKCIDPHFADGRNRAQCSFGLCRQLARPVVQTEDSRSIWPGRRGMVTCISICLRRRMAPVADRDSLTITGFAGRGEGADPEREMRALGQAAANPPCLRRGGRG